MGRKFVHEITPADIGKVVIEIESGKRINVTDFMGRILPIDIGKRIYRVGRIYQVENNAQRDKRILKIPKIPNPLGLPDPLGITDKPGVQLDAYGRPLILKDGKITSDNTRHMKLLKEQRKRMKKAGL
jgi:hypothetical protein